MGIDAGGDRTISQSGQLVCAVGEDETIFPSPQFDDICATIWVTPLNPNPAGGDKSRMVEVVNVSLDDIASFGKMHLAEEDIPARVFHIFNLKKIARRYATRRASYPDERALGGTDLGNNCSLRGCDNRLDAAVGGDD